MKKKDLKKKLEELYTLMHELRADFQKLGKAAYTIQEKIKEQQYEALKKEPTKVQVEATKAHVKRLRKRARR